MLPLILGGLAAIGLLKRNPRRRRRNPVDWKAEASRQADRLIADLGPRAALDHAYTRKRQAVMDQQIRLWSDVEELIKDRANLRTQREKDELKSNPALSAQLRKRLMEWRSPSYPAIKALAQAKYPATEANDALRQLMQQYERPGLKAGDVAHLAKTILMVERETGVLSNNPKDEKTLSQLAHEDPDACMDLCDRAALAICADAVRLGKYDSPYLKAITVKDALKDAKRNRRNPRNCCNPGKRLFTVETLAPGAYRVRMHVGRFDGSTLPSAFRNTREATIEGARAVVASYRHKSGATEAQYDQALRMLSRMGTRYNPPRRRRRGSKVTPAGAAARLAQWRWHHNPRTPSSYRLADGSLVSAAQLKRMFMGKIPTPAQRRLLGITVVADTR